MTQAEQPRISKTAIYVAAGRALGARESDVRARNPDYLAEKLLGDPLKLDVDHPVVHALSLEYEDAMRDLEVAMLVRMTTVRTRFIDDALERAISDGATQVVILGAGFDTYAYRHQDLLTDVRVFEVDRPAMQALKRKRVNEALGGPPENLTYVEIDLGIENLADTLMRHGYDSSQRTFYIVEGLTMYLPENVVRSTLRFVGLHSPLSGIVFDFVSRLPIKGLDRTGSGAISQTLQPIAERFFEMTEDEPWVFGIPRGGERGFLREFGLEVRELVRTAGKVTAKRYLSRTDGTQVGSEAIANAIAHLSADTQNARPIRSEERETLTTGMPQQQPLIAQLAEAFVSERISPQLELPQND